MILETGDRVLIAHRRLFADDPCRFFLGIVDGYEAGVARITGNSWVRDPIQGSLARKEDERTKVISLSSGSLLVYQLPRSLDPSKVEIVHDTDAQLYLADGNGFRMDLSERLHG